MFVLIISFYCLPFLRYLAQGNNENANNSDNTSNAVIIIMNDTATDNNKADF